MADNIVPIVADALVEAYGNDFLDLLDKVSRAIDTASLMQMTERLEVDGAPAADIARDFVEDTIGGLRATMSPR